jgi:hypothetical protein
LAGFRTADPSPWFTPPDARQQASPGPDPSTGPPATPQPQDSPGPQSSAGPQTSAGPRSSAGPIPSPEPQNRPEPQNSPGPQSSAELPNSPEPVVSAEPAEQPVAGAGSALPALPVETGPPIDQIGQGADLGTQDLLARVAAQLREQHQLISEPAPDQHAAVLSRPARQPRRPRLRRRRSEPRPARRPIRPIGPIRGTLVLLVALIVASALGWSTVTMAQAMLAAKPQNQQPAGPLADPPPAAAGTLPLRPGPIPRALGRNVIDTFRHRFASISAGVPDAVHPSGLYGEPGTVDPLTGRTAWIMYLGLGSTHRLGVPATTINRLMRKLLGNTTVGPWPARSGARGGSSECTVAVMASTKVAVCGWATDQTTGALMSPVRNTTPGELAMLMVQMRYELQLRAGQRP